VKWHRLQPVVLVLFSPLLACGQLVLSTVNPETPLGPSLDFGKIAAGDTKDVRVRARNNGAGPIPVTTLTIGGAGFSLPDKPSLPYSVAPGTFLDFTVHFTGSTIASYSANLQVNSTSVLLLASVAASATLVAGTGCTGPDSASVIDFGAVVSGSAVTCSYTLKNQNLQPVTVSNLAVTGAGFSGPQGGHAPVTIPAGEQISFTIAFNPTTPALYSGTMIIDSRSYRLSGTGTAPALPQPVLSYESLPLDSGQQRKLSLALPSPSPLPASGQITLSFEPDTPLVKDDASVMFAATGSRTVPYTIKQGETQVLLNGQASAIFQTGTTSGKIRFTISSNVPMTGDPVTVLTVAPSKIVFDNAIASRRTGILDVQITGFDNTYTAGSMAFSFYDRNGQALAAGPVSADFISAFRDYFSKSQAGSVFKAAISFPVTGDATQVGSVDVTFSNSVSVTTQHLTFPATTP
jgi:hypothetical protein